MSETQPPASTVLDHRAREGPPFERKVALWLGLLLVILGAIYASHTRLAQWDAWQREPGLHLANGVPMMTTLDAYYSLRLARLQQASTFVPHGPAPARHYTRPELDNSGTWYDQREPKELPLLSALIGTTAPFFGGSVDLAGLLLPPLLSSLFMLPLFWCCWRLGSPAAGLMGGLVGTFCVEYYRRTSIGWVDTDALNLFFAWLVCALFLSMSGTQTRERLLFRAALAGAVWFVFARWYPKPGLSLLFVVALAGHLALAGVGWRRVLLCVGIFAVFAGPSQWGDVWFSLRDAAHRYLGLAVAVPAQASSGVRFPEVWGTISEARALGIGGTLRAILPRADLTVVGLLALVPWLLRRWRALPALMPLLLLGALALVSSRRFIEFLAPWVGIGWGLIIAFIVQRLTEHRPRRREGVTPPTAQRIWNRPAIPVTVSLGVTLVTFGIWFAPRVAAHVPSPAIPAPVFRDLQALAHRLPADSRLWTWWDLGFAIVDTTGFGVYHDGSAQYTLQTNLIAASFVDRDPAALHDLIRYVDREGNRGILREASQAADLPTLLERMRKSAPPDTAVPVYVTFTADMLAKTAAMQTLATPLTAQPSSRPPPVGIRRLPCERLVDDRLHCGTATLDLRSGRVDRPAVPGSGPTPPARLQRAVLIKDGKVALQRDFTDTEAPTIQILMEANQLRAVYLLDETAFASNLNQMYLLGRFDRTRFEEVYNHFPFMRVFRTLPKPD